MKKVFKSFLVIIAAMVAFAGCVKQEIEAPTASELKIVQFFAESIETKTAFGTPDGTSYPTLWTANDKKIKLALNGNSASDVEVEVSSDYKTAKFEASFDENTTESCKFYALSPSTVYNNMSSSVISANIWESQTPSETSVDEAAQVLYAVSSEYSSLPSSISMNFKHFTAYGLLTLSNLNLNGAVVSSVAITASKNFAGRWNYEVANDRFVENSGSATITLHTSRTEGLWFACAPVDMSGQTLSVTVNTDKGTITRTVTLPADRKFEAGKISRFTIDMSSAVSDGPKVYELLTDIANLTVGSKVIIAAASTTSNYAISSTQNNNNRAGAAATKTGTTIVDPSESVEIFEVEEGTDTGTYAFKATKYAGYIYAAGGTSSNNYLKTQSTKDIVTSWTVEIDSNGKAVIVCAKSDVVRNTLRFNSTNGNLFSCYASGQNDVAIYRLQDSGSVPENYLNVSTTAIEVAADATTASFTVSSNLDWTATSDDAQVSFDGDVVNITFEANEEEVDQTYVVTVSAEGVDSKTVTITQAGVATEPEGPRVVTVAEFLAAPESETVMYQLTGTISGIYNTTYGNFYLTDAAGTKVLIYGLRESESASNTTFAKLGLKNGDKVTLVGIRSSHNGTEQAKNTYHVSSEKLASWDMPSITCSNNTVTIASSEAVTLYYTLDGTTPSVNSTRYTEPIAIETDVVVKAIAVAEGRPSSEVASSNISFVPVNPDVIPGGTADFNTITASASYGQGTTTAGWAYKNCAVLSGGTADSNPAYIMIGSASNRAFCMNGKTSAAGTITSPTLTTGCGTLTFNYGLPYSDNKIKFSVDIKQNGTVVKTFTINNSSASKVTKYSHEEVVNVSGDFQIIFTNLSPSGSTSNKDRTAIWDIEWTGYAD